ncbi:MAG: tetratricopeptide repeat protein [Moorea sp. SIO4G2]|uniref:Tetratricopeptide repeat protein n=2 Tax=Moorena TaxID=1155738 RepID=A0A1U7MY27_9CYAN|nr:tetratricopeptide repeat protein [Moorena bouillonii]NEO59893.1 tetratricopeptide repeat protein [Moorena sp. SIO4G2]OLT58564.1 hypothetical protein BJP37_05420 [Moorena bouillonii PNG]
MDEISETATSANPSSQDYREFLMEVLLAIAHSNGDPKVVYPLLQANLDKLDDNFIHILQAWASAKFSEAEPETAEGIARNIGNFSNLIKNFTLGNKANNVEIAMAGYEQLLTVFTRESNREIWAVIQTNLGNAYYQRIRNHRAENIELAIEAYQRALSVYTKTDFPIEWAITQNNLGTAYRDRIRHDRAQNLEKAIEAYELALSVRTKKDFPEDWAKTQNNLGNAYSQKIRGDKQENLNKAIAAYQLALSVRTPEANPINCLTTSRSLGNLHFTQGNWQPAIDAYEQGKTAVELMRSWAINDQRRQEIKAEAIEVYQKLAQAYINIGPI